MMDNDMGNVQLLHMLDIIKGKDADIERLGIRDNEMWDKIKELIGYIVESGNPTLMMHADRIGRQLSEMHADNLMALEEAIHKLQGATK